MRYNFLIFTSLALLGGMLTCARAQQLPVRMALPAGNSAEAVQYLCARGKIIVAAYDNTDPDLPQCFVQLDPAKSACRKMTLTMAASGARYADDKFVWWTKGNEGFLSKSRPGYGGRVLIRDCVEKEDPISE